MQIESASASQLVSYVFFLAISTAVGWIVRVLPGIRDDVRSVKREVMGLDGKNGLISKVLDHEGRLDLIDARHIKADVVTEIEKELAAGKLRRLRDRLRSEGRSEESP